MNDFQAFKNDFLNKSRHHSKLIKFIYPELIEIKDSNILEFGVSEKAMSTELFLEYSNINNCKLFSVDCVDFSGKFNHKNWYFINSRDDEYEKIFAKIPKNFDLILLDTIHEAKHVEKIFYKYYDFLNVNCCFFIDDTNWIPYLKKNEKNNFYVEINNRETFEILLEIYSSNRENFEIEFTFQGTGMCKITKKNNNQLNLKKNIYSRKYSLKNLVRKILKK